MALRTSFMTKVSTFLGNLNSVVDELIRRSLIKNGYVPALAGLEQPKPSGASFDLREIFDKGFVWCPTPKHRTSAEKKLTKRFLPLANNFITKYSKPKTNIMTCLECGNYHEKGTLCGKCYEKVKLETQKVQEEMLKNDQFKYNYPNKEIKFVYQGEEKELKSNELIIEVPSKRPSWFNSDLITKVTSKIK